MIQGQRGPPGQGALWTEAARRRKAAPDRPLGWRGRSALDRRRAGSRCKSGTRGMRPYGAKTICAILVRASHQMRAFEDRFLTIGLALPRDRRPPLLRADGNSRCNGLFPRGLTSPDDDLAFERIVNTPKRGAWRQGATDDPACGAGDMVCQPFGRRARFVAHRTGRDQAARAPRRWARWSSISPVGGV